MGVYICRAILHIAYNDGRAPVISNEELDFESEACSEFINKHIKKIANDPSAKEATFEPDSEIYSYIMEYKKNPSQFKELSEKIFNNLAAIIAKYPDIPSGDILFVHFKKDEIDNIAIVKLNYKECYTHKIDLKEDGADNQIVKYHSVLPFSSGKITEACVIPFDPMIIRLVEKPYVIDGESRNYFSDLFLNCTAGVSKQEAVQIINDVTEEINHKFFDDKIEPLVKIKTAIIEEAEENEGVVRMENIADSVFNDNPEIKKEYIETLRESGIQEDIELGEKYSLRQFGTQTFKSENGVVIKFPSELSLDEDSMEIIHHADKTVTITFKNLRQK